MQIRTKLWGAIIFRFQGRLGWSKEQRAKKHHAKLRKPQKKIEIGQYRRAGGYLQRGGSYANPDLQVVLVVDAPKQNKDRLWWRRWSEHLSPCYLEKAVCDLKIVFWSSSSLSNFNFNVNFELKLKLKFGDEDDHQNKILRSQSNFSRQHGDKCWL